MRHSILALTCALVAQVVFANELEDWDQLYYPGLEASGEVKVNPTGFRGTDPAIELTYLSGMPNFGVRKSVKSELKGCVEWTVSARLKCAPGGYARASMEFFDAKGKTLGRQDGPRRIYTDWERTVWKFTSPRSAARGEVHLVNCERTKVAFARIEISSAPGIDKGELPFKMAVLPVDWNKDWNGGKYRMKSFSDAPIPLSVLFAGDRKELKAPWFEIELPSGLELKSAYCPYAQDSGVETPSASTVLSNGTMRLRFDRLIFFRHMDRVNYVADRGGAVSLVLMPKSGDAPNCSFAVVCRIGDGEKLAEERRFELVFGPLPKGTDGTDVYPVFSWNNIDRCFPDDAVAALSLPAYERAGISSFRKQLTNDPSNLARNKALVKFVKSRGVKSIFSGRFGDLTRPGVSRLSKAQLKAWGLHKSTIFAGGKLKPEASPHICPQRLIDSAEYRQHLRDTVVRPSLTEADVVDGDLVTIDIEPWQANEYCFCADCLKAFAAFAKLDEVPDAATAQGMRDAWAMFRVGQNSRLIELISACIHEFNPALKVFDYDYILKYGDEEQRMRFLRGCAKDPEMNERSIDGHFCSYYHTIGKASFEAMRNNRRHLKKAYFPLGGMCGYGSYLRPGEVLNPAQIRQFALAAFVNGCDGYGFYSGNYYDGEILEAMIDAQVLLAPYKNLPWGKVDGKVVPESASNQFACASTVRPDGTEVLALFNYDTEDTITVKVAGETLCLKPNEVRFIVL